MTTVTMANVSLSYGTRPALRDVSLVVPSGSLVAILGPSGCGKTSLLMALAGLVSVNGGIITVGSRELSSEKQRIPPEQRGVGWVPQAASLFPHLSVGDNIGFALPKGRRRNERVDELAHLVGLEGFLNRSPGQLSGGQAQRVALARALAPKPDVLLLDEPFGALDSVLRHSLARDVARILRDQETTAILVTHDREEALDLADFVAVMDRGRIVQAGTPREVYESPATPWVASFVGDTVEAFEHDRLGTRPHIGVARQDQVAEGAEGLLVPELGKLPLEHLESTSHPLLFLLESPHELGIEKRRRGSGILRPAGRGG